MNIIKSILTGYIVFAGMVVKGQIEDSMEVTNATQCFLKAFINFHWINFRNFFSNDATTFFLSGRKESEECDKKKSKKPGLICFRNSLIHQKNFILKLNPKIYS
jgi:hypothetical protein